MSSLERQAEVVTALGALLEREHLWAMVTTGVGAFSIVVALGCWLIVPRARGAGWPMFLLGVVWLSSGGVRLRASNFERSQLSELVREAPHLVEERLLPDAELQRSTHRWLQWVDGGLLVAAAVLLTRRGALRSAGVGLLVSVVVAIGLDTLALERWTRRVTLLRQLADLAPLSRRGVAPGPASVAAQLDVGASCLKVLTGSALPLTGSGSAARHGPPSASRALV